MMATETKERPIPFSLPMVLALLNTVPGDYPARPIDPAKPFKCQTRRVINPIPVDTRKNDAEGRSLWRWGGEVYTAKDLADKLAATNPYGQPGDLLWVRESHRVIKDDKQGTVYVQYPAGQTAREIATYRPHSDEGLLEIEERVVQHLLLYVLLQVHQGHVQEIHRLIQAWIDLHLLLELRPLVESCPHAHATTSGRRYRSRIRAVSVGPKYISATSSFHTSSATVPDTRTFPSYMIYARSTMSSVCSTL